ncbi:uncharacterized protein LOC134775177 [Penaeus indicus]|uniref:uncharacterized protein LOC134775177 n=1 Tax=Penaeus indicus TaxID=29960 RepID=UPI00300DB6CD
MTGRSREVAETMKQRKVKILCVQEVMWRGGGVREIGGYKLCYSGSRTGRNGVGIILDEELKQRVVEVQRPSDRLMTFKVLARKSLINIVSGYAPQIGCEDQEKEEFREQLEQSVREIPEEEEIILGADLNCGDGSSQIDFLVVRKRIRKYVKDAKVIPGEAVAHHKDCWLWMGRSLRKGKEKQQGRSCRSSRCGNYGNVQENTEENEWEELTELPAVEGLIQQVSLQKVSAVLKKIEEEQVSRHIGGCGRDVGCLGERRCDVDP